MFAKHAIAMATLVGNTRATKVLCRVGGVACKLKKLEVFASVAILKSAQRKIRVESANRADAELVPHPAMAAPLHNWFHNSSFLQLAVGLQGLGCIIHKGTK